ncbi:putative metallo-beta-lactamase, cleavage and polyadenylation specificity factor 2 [Helianthus debilis subsp. tardiflorus]
MGTSVQVTPLRGVYNENPLSYLVSIDGFNILIDCGWNDHFDPSLLQPLSRIGSRIDAVLLSHSDTLHLGALPFAIKHFGLWTFYSCLCYRTDYEIAWIDSEIEKTESGTLSSLPLSTTAPPHRSVLVSDLKMADFKQFLSAKGIQVEFSGGTLRCGE